MIENEGEYVQNKNVIIDLSNKIKIKFKKFKIVDRKLMDPPDIICNNSNIYFKGK